MNDIMRIIVYVFVDLNNRQSYSKVVLIYQSIPEFIPYQHTWIYTSFIRNNGAILFLAKMSTNHERVRESKINSALNACAIL